MRGEIEDLPFATTATYSSEHLETAQLVTVRSRATGRVYGIALDSSRYRNGRVDGVISIAEGRRIKKDNWCPVILGPSEDGRTLVVAELSEE